MRHVLGILATGVLMAVLGAVGMALSVWVFWHTPAKSPWDELAAFAGVFSFIFFGGGILTIIEGLVASAVSGQVVVEPDTVRLGETLTAQATLIPHRDLQAGPVTFTLIGRERMRFRLTRYRYKTEKTATPIRVVVPVAEKVTLLAGQPHTFTAHIAVPPNAMPSFFQQEPLGELWAFEWVVHFRFGVPHWPDVNTHISIRVEPVWSRPAPLDKPLTDLTAPTTLSPAGPLYLTLAHTALAVGESVSGRVVWQGPAGQPAGRALRVELGYRTLAGKWPWEKRRWEHVVAQQTFEPTPGREWLFTLPIPQEGPITYTGSLYRVTWFVRAVLDRPFKQDERVELPIHVLPRQDILEA